MLNLYILNLLHIACLSRIVGIQHTSLHFFPLYLPWSCAQAVYQRWMKKIPISSNNYQGQGLRYKHHFKPKSLVKHLLYLSLFCTAFIFSNTNIDFRQVYLNVLAHLYIIHSGHLFWSTHERK